MRFYAVLLPLMMAEDLGGSYYGDRWSLALARPPGWLDSESPAVIGFYHDLVFDNPNVGDPNGMLADIEAQTRAEAQRLGIRLSDDSAGVLRVYGRLQVGETTWKAVAGQTGSVTPTGAGALSTPYLDAYRANEVQAIDAFRAAPPASGINASGGPEETDALVLAYQMEHGYNFDAGLSRPIALSPQPAPQMRDAVAFGQSSNAAPVSGASLTSFFGSGTRGTLFDFAGGGGSGTTAAPGPRTGGNGIPTWLLLALVAGAGYFLYKKGS